jgi:hypothetical protein
LGRLYGPDLDRFSDPFYNTVSCQLRGFKTASKTDRLLVAATLEDLYKQGKQSQTLEQLCAKILEFAEKY